MIEMLIAYIQAGETTKVRKLLDENSALANQHNKDELFPLVLATFYGYSLHVALLLKAGADPKTSKLVIQDSSASSLQIACVMNHIDCLWLFIGHFLKLPYHSDDHRHIQEVNGNIQQMPEVNAKTKALMSKFLEKYSAKQPVEHPTSPSGFFGLRKRRVASVAATKSRPEARI